MAKIFIVDRENQADITACEVNHELQADILVFVEDNQNRAKGDEKWFYVDRENQADTKLCWVKNANHADLKVHFVDHGLQAKWRKSHKLRGHL